MPNKLRIVVAQALAADGAIACLSSYPFLLGLNADGAPQVKRGVRYLRTDSNDSTQNK